MNMEQRAVQIIRMGTLTVYEITDDELRLIETGGPASTLLNFGIGSLSLSVGIFATLLSGGPISSRIISDTLVILTALGLLAGVVLLVLWRRFAKQTSSTIAGVRDRAKIQAQVTATQIITTFESSESGEGS